MRNIVAIDDSPYSAQVVAAIAARRWPAGSEFKVLSVVEPLEALEIAEEDDIESATQRIATKPLSTFALRPDIPCKQLYPMPSFILK